MNEEATSDRLQRALAAHAAGQLDEAEQGYRAILEVESAHPDALHLLGLVLDQRNHLDEAIALIERAIAVAPRAGVYQLNLGNVLRRRGRFDSAERAWRRAAILAPELSADAYASVAALSAEQGRPRKDVACWQRVANAATAALAAPQDAAGCSALAEALADAGDTEAAIFAALAACRLEPQTGRFHNRAGSLLMQAGRPAEAVAAFGAAAALLPQDARVMSNLAAALAAGQRDLTEAVAAARRAIALDPKFAGGYEMLAVLARDAGRPAESAAAARQAIALSPSSPRAHDSLGNALFDLGNIDAAVTEFRRAIDLDPQRVGSHSNLLMVSHYATGFDPAALWDESRRWARRHADPITATAIKLQPHLNDRDPLRRLRIGYVSPDFCRHPVALFFAPLLRNHNREAVDVILYSNTQLTDDVSARFRELAGGWRDIVSLSDDEAAQLVRDDRIDILVDLAGHTAHNRLLLLARKPAPVQATYIGYWNTSGMAAVDYRLTDAWSDPPGLTEHLWTEKLERLDGGAWCFQPPTSRPEVNDSPAQRDGVVTFISANKPAKVSTRMLQLWRQILERSARARLIVVTGGDEQRVREALRGVDRSRYELMGRVPVDEYFRLYHRADVLLDVMPHNGHTTSVDALWMGVPVLSLTGPVHCSRLGASLLSAIGLEEFICETPEQYVDRAVALEQQIDHLADLRRAMRKRILDSPLADGKRLARSVEGAYREMWHRWCGGA